MFNDIYIYIFYTYIIYIILIILQFYIPMALHTFLIKTKHDMRHGCRAYYIIIALKKAICRCPFTVVLTLSTDRFHTYTSPSYLLKIL